MPGKLIRSIEFAPGHTFEVVIYDLLAEQTDCIVNAANGGLSHGGGVAAAIERAAGPALTEEGDRLVRERGRIPVGGAVVTTAGKLPFKGVIHAVGPRLGDGNEEGKLAQALTQAFTLAAEKRWRSLSFPAVSSGIFAVPIDVCARAYVRAVQQFFSTRPDTSLATIRLCLFEGPVVDTVARLIDALATSR
jgi:O-acetyl-ADP-ribose deacetylase (regulator of RNase III)